MALLMVVPSASGVINPCMYTLHKEVLLVNCYKHSPLIQKGITGLRLFPGQTQVYENGDVPQQGRLTRETDGKESNLKPDLVKDTIIS